MIRQYLSYVDMATNVSKTLDAAVMSDLARRLYADRDSPRPVFTSKDRIERLVSSETPSDVRLGIASEKVGTIPVLGREPS